MSQLDSTSASPIRTAAPAKPKTNIYTVVLIISLLMMLFGCLMMYLELKQLTG